MGTYNVHGGHNRIVPGASHYLDEVTEDRRITAGVISMLRYSGHTAYDCTDDAGKTVGANLANIVAKCNTHSADLDISIHQNAAKVDPGDGKPKVWKCSYTVPVLRLMLQLEEYAQNWQHSDSRTGVSRSALVCMS